MGRTYVFNCKLKKLIRIKGRSMTTYMAKKRSVWGSQKAYYCPHFIEVGRWSKRAKLCT